MSLFRWVSLSFTCAILSFYHALTAVETITVDDYEVSAIRLPIVSSLNQHHNVVVPPSPAVLLAWEIESLKGNDEDSALRSCHPPSHVHMNCCLGTFSLGGDVDAKNRHHCLPFDETLLRHLEEATTSVITSEADCDICQIVQLLANNNLTMAFVGDSMTNQVFQAMLCELQKRHYVVEVEKEVAQNPSRCKTCLKWTLHVRVMILSEVVDIKFYFIYRVPFESLREQALVLGTADILVMNFGLHWSWNGRRVETTRMHYRKSMVQLLEAYQNITASNPKRLLLWRETSAQHFDADGGDWGLRRPQSNNNNDNISTELCVPMTVASKQVANWRTKWLRKAARSVKHSVELKILPWWNFTAQLHQMHPPQECSHYCSFPALYHPIWMHMRQRLEEKYESEPSLLS